MMPVSAIDPAAIENLRSLAPDDPETFLREIVGIFLDDTPIRLADLRNTLASDDRVAFTRAAHSIKGSSSNIGALSLRALAATLETRSRDEPLAGLASLVAELEATYTQTKFELEKILEA
jgi:HPt (histidine-containing phosphotransfer) domain-containing protein